MSFALALLLLACTDKDKGTTPPDDSETPIVEDDSGDSTEDSEPQTPDLCATLGLPVRPWQDATDDDSLGALAADLTLETTTGPWTLSAAWSGCESYLFIPSQPQQATGWPQDLWARDGDTKSLFKDLPPNTQVFFVSSGRAESTQEEEIAAIQAGVESALSSFSEEDAAWWTAQVHYLVGRDSKQPGWLGQTLDNPGWGVAIDRFQRIRYIGSFADPRRYNSSYGWFEPNISMAANEAVYYNFEAERDDAMQAEGAEVRRLFDGDVCAGNAYGEVELPDAEELLSYDTLTLDLTMACQGPGEYGYCPAWDYMAYLFACDEPLGDNPYASTPCQPAVAETLGLCDNTGASCRSETDCGDADTGELGSCVGYIAAIAAETRTGLCSEPGGGTAESSYTCASDGSGFQDLSCPCDTEVGRWITTYHREGRWVYDISSYLPLIAQGGLQRFRFETSGPYELTLDMRLSNQGKAARPETTTFLFGPGGIYTGSNALYEPVTVNIPADATKVELATVISGHGSDGENCGEFCDMAHWYVINGDTSKAIVREFPEAGTTWGCRDQVGIGTIPNQYGTWWYGRAGWCPGLEVPTVVHDITDQIVFGADNTFVYYALFEGAEYTGYSTNRMNAWLVVSY